MKHRHRIRVAPGIYDDRSGRAVTVKVGGVQREQRFPPGHDLELCKSWQVQTRAELDRERPDEPADPKPIRGTFAADLERYLPLIVGRVGYKADRSHLKAWLPHIGAKNRALIKLTDIRKAIGVWNTKGLSPRTIRHRVRVVRELYRGLDGAHAKPPLKGLILEKPADPNPTPVSIELIQRVAASLKAGLSIRKRCGPKRTLTDVHCIDPDKCHARFLVRATTGQRPTQIMRAQPEDLDFDRGIWFVRPAKQGRAIPLPLQPETVWAWQAFIAADAWGTFDTRSFSKTIQRHGWPKGIRPYTLRHTFAIDHLLGGTDIGDLQGLLGHRQIETTRKFYGPVLQARLKQAGAKRTLKLA